MVVIEVVVVAVVVIVPYKYKKIILYRGRKTNWSRLKAVLRSPRKPSVALNWM